MAAPVSKSDEVSRPTTTDASASDVDDENAKVRVEALRWIHQALSDIDRAIETGHHDTAKQLLHRVQDVLDLPAVNADDETR